MFNETVIVPGERLGNSLVLGESMFSIVKQLNKFDYKLKISYSDNDYLNVPVTVTLVEYGIRLIFDKTQALTLIEVLDVGGKHKRPAKLIYKGISLNEYEGDSTVYATAKDSSSSTVSSVNSLLLEDTPATLTSPTLRQIYNKIFGPTYPGTLGDHTYTLSYPGVSFRFALANEELYRRLVESRSESNGDDKILSELLNWDNPTDVRCKHIALYKGKSWQSFKFDVVEDNNFLVKVLLPNRNISFQVGGEEKIIVVGASTQQRVLSILGPPDTSFNKYDSRLLIHKHLRVDSAEQEVNQYKFHNYFRLGIDVLYDLGNHECKLSSIVKKVIIHNGLVAESLNFMKWGRCNWEITGVLDESAIKFDSSMYFKQLPQQLQKLVPVLLNRNETEFIDNDLDIIGIQKRPAAADSKVKTWGQSRLYGFDGCIFEVLDSNGVISTVTIF